MNWHASIAAPGTAWYGRVPGETSRSRLEIWAPGHTPLTVQTLQPGLHRDNWRLVLRASGYNPQLAQYLLIGAPVQSLEAAKVLAEFLRQEIVSKASYY
jgi:hypothetical protein